MTSASATGVDQLDAYMRSRSGQRRSGRDEAIPPSLTK